MAPGDLAGRLLELTDPAEQRDLLQTTLGDAAAHERFLCWLKAEAERLWAVDPRASLRLAEALMCAARLVDRPDHLALALMAKADTLRYLGRYPESATLFEQAADAFRTLGDEVGWARTRIGWLVTAHLLGRSEDGLADAHRAHVILVRHHEWLRAAGLDLNTGVVCVELGHYQRARRLYDRAIRLYARARQADPTLGEVAEVRAAKAAVNKAIILALLGDPRAALPLHEEARRMFLRHGELVPALRQQHNIAQVYLGQGYFTRALGLLSEALVEAEQAGVEDEAGWIALEMAECYLRLNRDLEALELAEQASTRFDRCGTPTETAKAHFYSALAHARLGASERAHELLAQALRVFDSAHLVSQSALARLQLAEVQLRRGDGAAAGRTAARARRLFAERGLVVREAQAQLVQARVALALGAPGRAERLAQTALATARAREVVWLAHEGHHILARVALRRGAVPQALVAFEAAVTSIEQVQGHLASELCSTFLADKLHVYQDAIDCCLGAGAIHEAFDYLERAKSRALLAYLARNLDVRLRVQRGRSPALLNELARLREEHNWLYDRLYRQAVARHWDVGRTDGGIEELQALVRDREKRIGHLLERLALLDAAYAEWSPPGGRPMRPAVGPGTVLVEYYLRADGGTVFLLSDTGLVAEPLPVGARTVQGWLRRWQLNLDTTALALAAGTPLAPLSHNALGLLRDLYGALLRPVEAHLAGRERLVVIPYGPLHGVPFHALHDGRRFVLEALDVSTCPSSGVLRLCAERRHRPADRALVVAHSEGGRLPYTLEEARLVAALLPGTLLVEEQATRAAVVHAAPRHGVVHIAAHGEARLDNPAFAHLKLADGQLSSVDVFNLELDGALVTLSACETGRSQVTGGDELVGLSRGFLYAGASTLVQSLWRVDDASTARLMDAFYRALCMGQPPATALRQAQLGQLAGGAGHPYFWAPFQLVGEGTVRRRAPQPPRTIRGAA